jgi:hypothetical protein
MKKVYFTFFCVLLSCAAFSQSKNVSAKEKFFGKLKQCQLKWNVGNKYTEREIAAAASGKYDYAIADWEDQCEIRYKIIPLHHFRKSSKDYKMTNQETLFKSSVASFVYNISGVKNFPYQAFPASAVQKDFNADAGGQVLIKAGADAGNKYKNIYLVSFYKEDKAIVLISFLFNNLNRDKLKALISETYKSVRFQ